MYKFLLRMIGCVMKYFIMYFLWDLSCVLYLKLRCLSTLSFQKVPNLGVQSSTIIGLTLKIDTIFFYFSTLLSTQTTFFSTRPDSTFNPWKPYSQSILMILLESNKSIRNRIRTIYSPRYLFGNGTLLGLFPIIWWGIIPTNLFPISP